MIPSYFKGTRKVIRSYSSNWNFLTGDRQTIFDLSNKGFNLYAGQTSQVKGGFEHSGLFALIDKKWKYKM
jgi:protein SCO1/2